jgi:hypothetical protein
MLGEQARPSGQVFDQGIDAEFGADCERSAARAISEAVRDSEPLQLDALTLGGAKSEGRSGIVPRT